MGNTSSIPHFSYFRLRQNLTPHLLAPLCGVSLELLNEQIQILDKLQKEEAPKAYLYTKEPRAQPLRCNYEICAIFKFAHIRVCAYRLCSAKLSFSEAMPSPGGEVPPQGADEERRHPLIRNADKLEGTAFKNCTVLRTAFTIDTFRRSSSVSLRSTANKSRYDCHRQSF